jgi:hypothetical protein
MTLRDHRKFTCAVGIFLFFWFLSGCAYRQPPIKPTPEEPPPPVKIVKPVLPVIETPVKLKPEMAARPKPEPNAVEPKKPSLKISTPPVSTAGFFSHKVRWSEETLSHIAQWYTGTMKNWKVLAKANPELDPKKIGPGDTVLIPENLLISRKPIPYSFLHPFNRKKAKPSPLPKKTKIPSDSPKLFGPIENELPLMKSDSAKLFGPVE